MKSRNTDTATPSKTSDKMLPTDRAIKYIDRLIGVGTLQPGDTVSEPRIGDALNIGRVPVREAIRMLAGEGLLELTPYKGAKVRSINSEEILEIHEVLVGLTITAIYRLTENPIKKELAKEIVNYGKQVVKSTSSDHTLEIAEQVNRFHYLLMTTCGNNYLVEIVKKIRIKRYTKYLIELIGHDAYKEVALNYNKMAKLIVNRDASSAESLMLASTKEALSSSHSLAT